MPDTVEIIPYLFYLDLPAGAVIEEAPHILPYGRMDTARDLEGHPWYFTARAAG